MTDPAYIDTLVANIWSPSLPMHCKDEIRAAIRALVADAVRQARAPWPTCAKCGAYGHVAIDCLVALAAPALVEDEDPEDTARIEREHPWPSPTPRAQAEALLRKAVCRANEFTLATPPHSMDWVNELRTAAEALLAAPPEPQAPPPDRVKLIARIEKAIDRITTGQKAMRVPADDTDPDVVLDDCRAALCLPEPPPDRAAWYERAIGSVVCDEIRKVKWDGPSHLTLEEWEALLKEPLRWPVAGDEGLRELRVNVGAPVRSEPFIIEDDAKPSGLAPTPDSKPGCEGSIPSSVATPRAQAEARLRARAWRVECTGLLAKLSMASCFDAPRLALAKLLDEAEALLAAPPEPQAPPPDRAAWREMALELVLSYVGKPSIISIGRAKLSDVTAHLDKPLRWPVAGDEGLRTIRDLVVEKSNIAINAMCDPTSKHRANNLLEFRAGMDALRDNILREIDRLLLARAPAAPLKEKPNAT